MKLYRADYIIPISAPPLKEGGVLVQDGAILKFGKSEEIKKNYSIKEEINYKNSTLLPGLVNPHTHLELSSFTPPEKPYKSMTEWILNIIPTKLSISDVQKRANVRNGLDALIRSGTTAFGDNLSWWELADAYIDSPLSGVIFLEIIGLDDNQVSEKIKTLSKKISEKHHNNFSLGFAPHSVYSASDLIFEELKALHHKFPLPVSIHLQESKDEEDFTRKGSGGIAEMLYPILSLKNNALERFGSLSSTDYLIKRGFFSLSPILVHNCYVENEEIPILQKLNVKPVFCLRSNKTLNNKMPDLPEWLKIFGAEKVGIGTDSLASAESLSLWDEMRFIKEVFPEISDEILLVMATVGGANALSLGNKKGSVAKGKDADFIIVNTGDFNGNIKELTSFIVDNTDEFQIEYVITKGEECLRKKG